MSHHCHQWPWTPCVAMRYYALLHLCSAVCVRLTVPICDSPAVATNGRFAAPAPTLLSVSTLIPLHSPSADLDMSAR